MITAYFIEHDHIKWSCCRSLFVHHAHLQFWNVMAKPPRRRNSFHSHDITGTTQHHIRLKVTFIACPVPYGQTTGAVFNGFLHVQELKVRLLANDNEVHIIPAAETMVSDGK